MRSTLGSCHTTNAFHI